MTKKLTEEQVFEQLVDNASAEVEGLGEQATVRYYLHVKEDGAIVDSYRKADATFTDWIPYWDYADTLEEFDEVDVYDYERMDFGPFVQVVRHLASDANEWLEKVEQEEEEDEEE